jgi:probable lipoprotein NlpC
MTLSRNNLSISAPESALFWLLALTVLMGGCADTGSRSTVLPDSTGSTSGGIVAKKLRQAARDWWRTPHRMGGTSKAGIDCSGLVMVLFKDLFAVSLPRTTARQMAVGSPVVINRWQPGDLVFFKPHGKVRHVGIYLGDGVFLHASSSRGVRIDRLQDPFWQGCYTTARRVL